MLKNTDEVFLFLRKFLLYLESEDECYNRYFIQSNPLAFKSKNIEFLNNFNIQIGNFLDETYKSVKENINDDPKKGETACYIGVSYEYGLFNKPKEHSLAFYYYKVSTKLNNNIGAFKLATCYERGLGTAINYKKAIHFYKCAANLKLVEGMHIYGNILLKGFLNSKKKIYLGKQFLELAAKNADITYPYALFDLAKLYEHYDEEVETDKSYEHNYNQIESEKSYKNIDGKVETDTNYVHKIYIRGAELGDSNCIYRLAKAYETGDLSKKINLKKAYEFYKLAAEMGHSSAQLKVSELYYHGNFNKQNKPEFSKALKWAIFAATKENIRASYVVGNYILNGCGTKKNKLLALWWFTISSIYGYDEANVKLKKLNNWVNKNNQGHLKKMKNTDRNTCCYLF